MEQANTKTKDTPPKRTLVQFTDEQWEYLKNLRKSQGKMTSGFIRDLVQKAMTEEHSQSNA